MITSNNRKWLIVIAVILVGIFTVMLMDRTQTNTIQKTEGEKVGESISDIIDSIGDGADEFQEEVADEIDDNTTDRR